MTPVLSIIILNYRSKEFCDKCLRSLFLHPIDVDFEIILVDNDSQDDSITYIQERWGDKVRYIQNERNEGFGMAHNIAIKEALGEYIVIINPDIEVHENTINTLLEYLKSHPQCGIVGPQLIYPDGTIQDSYRNFPTISDLIIKRTFLRKLFKNRMKHYLMYDFDPKETREVDWMVGACLMMKKENYDKIGGFDKRYFLFMEDVDLCRSMWEAGFEVIYLPKAKANHHHDRLSGGKITQVIFKKTFYLHIASAIKYFWKWGIGGNNPRFKQVSTKTL